MRYLSLGEIVDLHQALVDQTGGATGIRDLPGLESALPHPSATFDNRLIPHSRSESRGAGYSLMLNHPFVQPQHASFLDENLMGVRARSLRHVIEVAQHDVVQELHGLKLLVVGCLL